MANYPTAGHIDSESWRRWYRTRPPSPLPPISEQWRVWYTDDRLPHHRRRDNTFTTPLDSPLSSLTQSSSSSAGIYNIPRLHHVLKFSSSTPLPLRFDLQAPYKDALESNSRVVSPSILTESATLPGVHHMRLVCEEIPWPIDISTGGSRSKYVTVEDILHALHTSLRHPLSDSEMYIAGPERLEVVKRHAARRVDKYFSKHKKNPDGPLRVDWLKEMTMFIGLTAIKDDSTRWRIHLSSRRSGR